MRAGGGEGEELGGGGKGGVGDEVFWVGGESGRWEMGDGWGRNELKGGATNWGGGLDGFCCREGWVGWVV